MEPALWHDGGVFPHSNVTSVHNQIHKIIQDHTGQTVKMGQIYVQFSKHNCGNIGFYLSHYLILLSHFLIHFSWNMWCLMYKGKHAHFWMEHLTLPWRKFSVSRCFGKLTLVWLRREDLYLLLWSFGYVPIPSKKCSI